MIDSLVEFLQTLPWWGILAFTFFICFIENIFPPSPSDVILVFIGSLVGMGTVDFGSTVVVATLGSTIGFATMFHIGKRFDASVVESGRFRFLPLNTIHKAESWFARWGYYVIIANRFLSGTRAIISFFAGMSQMKFLPCVVLSGLSALAWNAIIIYAGSLLGKNWREVESYLSTYGNIVSIILVALALFFLVRFFMKKKAEKSS